MDFRDERVDGGMDPGTCTPGDIDAQGYIIQTHCALDGVRRVRIDLGDREDRATVALAIPVTLLGGTGADDVTGGSAADEVGGGEGDDRLAGGAGDDVLAGDGGADAIDGGGGNDRIAARDGVADTIACGPGDDVVEADDADAVAADCERVSRVTTAPAGNVTDDGRPPVVDAGSLTVQRITSRRVVRVYATTSEAGTLGASGALEATGLTLPIKRVAPKRIAVAGGGAPLDYRLTGRHWRLARKAFARDKKVRLRLAVVATDRVGRSTLRELPAITLVDGRGGRTARAAHPEPGDVDGDEVRDEFDNCPNDRNGSQVNTDRDLVADPPMPGGDAAGDACDADDDADGVLDAGDNCRVVRNPGQEPLEPGSPYGSACPPVDDDGDGLVNVDDNCDAVANADQLDLDGDDKGDACDLDRDGDRIDDRFDNCPTIYNLEPTDLDGNGFVDDQLDRDGDGIGTACDPDERAIDPPPTGPPAPPADADPAQAGRAGRRAVLAQGDPVRARGAAALRRGVRGRRRGDDRQGRGAPLPAGVPAARRRRRGPPRGAGHDLRVRPLHARGEAGAQAARPPRAPRRGQRRRDRRARQPAGARRDRPRPPVTHPA